MSTWIGPSNRKRGMLIILGSYVSLRICFNFITIKIGHRMFDRRSSFTWICFFPWLLFAKKEETREFLPMLYLVIRPLSLSLANPLFSLRFLMVFSARTGSHTVHMTRQDYSYAPPHSYNEYKTAEGSASTCCLVIPPGIFHARSNERTTSTCVGCCVSYQEKSWQPNRFLTVVCIRTVSHKYFIS